MILQGVEDVEFCELTSRSVVRHPLVGRIVDAYGHYDDKPRYQFRSVRNVSIDIANESGWEGYEESLVSQAEFVLERLRIHPQPSCHWYWWTKMPCRFCTSGGWMSPGRPMSRASGWMNCAPGTDQGSTGTNQLGMW